jgi:hypothetical protein
MRNHARRRADNDNYSTGFPMLFVASAMFLMATYLAIGTTIFWQPEPRGRVFVSIQDVPVGRLVRVRP